MVFYTFLKTCAILKPKVRRAAAWQSEGKEGFSMGKFSYVPNALRTILQDGNVGNAVAVYQDGKCLFEDYAGWADREKGIPTSRDTMYRIYSMSKPIAYTAGLMLFERGLFSMTDPVGAFLPEFQNAKVLHYDDHGEPYFTNARSPILIWHLFTMTSGIAYGTDPTAKNAGGYYARAMNQLIAETGNHYSLAQMVSRLKDVPISFDPGTAWEYGYSADIVGRLVEVLTGKTFYQFLREEIFEPLDMPDTVFVMDEGQRARLAQMYELDLRDLSKPAIISDMRTQPKENTLMESGGGGLKSTLHDYSHFAQGLVCGYRGTRLLGRRTLEMMHTNQLPPEVLAGFSRLQPGYGYGCGVRTLMDPGRAHTSANAGEFGWAGAAGTYLDIDPVERVSIVYMQHMMPGNNRRTEQLLRASVYGAL